MITVTTILYREEGEATDAELPEPTYWRAGCALVDFGSQEPSLMVSSSGQRYPSQEAAHAAMRSQALEKIRERGRREPEDQIQWKVQIGS